MPLVSLTLSAADLTRVVNALSVRFGYVALLPDGSPNPQTAQEFVRLRLGQWVRDETRAHELAQAQVAVVVSPVSIT